MAEFLETGLFYRLVRHQSPIHRDPFDRMLACQAIELKLTLITVDDVFRGYPTLVLERS
jgi:PIN domain nuclease of toxin-antitoxin system